MKRKLTYAQKNKLLLAVAALMLWISWSFGFKKTFAAVSACSDLEAKSEAAADLPAREEALKKDLILLESKIGSSEDSLAFQQRLLKTISLFCDSAGLSIYEYPGAELKQETGYLVETHSFTIQGNFHALVRLIHYLEREKGTGKIAAADFKKIKNQRHRREELCLVLYINHTFKKSS